MSCVPASGPISIRYQVGCKSETRRSRILPRSERSERGVVFEISGSSGRPRFSSADPRKRDVAMRLLARGKGGDREQGAGTGGGNAGQGWGFAGCTRGKQGV